jgi:hypothetical protein
MEATSTGDFMRGTCALTKTEGELIASHLLPKALTRPSKRGRPLIQISSGKKPVRRWDSWYDDQLVTLQGEKLLTDLDTWAIAAMRKHRRVWSGGQGADSLAGHFTPLSGSPWGIRRVNGLDTRRLRLFFMSLLWRAAATSRPEFHEVSVPDADLEQLRHMILSGSSDPAGYYQVTLTQLSTKGVIQNMPPIAQYKEVRSTVPGLPHRLERIFRFYLDGLIAHVRLPEGTMDQEELGAMVLGACDEVVISTVTYERSFQRENLEFVQEETLPSALSWER